MLFCFGMGYVAKKFTNFSGMDYIGTKTTKDDSCLLFDGKNIPDISVYKNITHILISVPPIANDDIVYRECLTQIKNLPKLKWLGYLSATSVYQDAKGQWVDENYPLCQSSQDIRGTARLNAEKLWLEADLPTHIFRLSGIYGPGRSVIEQIKAGTARRIFKENQFFSRIHVEDICNIVLASINKSNPGSIYNVADDHPCSNLEIVEFACKLMNKNMPILEKYEEAEMSEMLRSFYNNSRKIKNQKIKEELGVKLKFPSYKEGLTEIYNENR